MVPPVIFLGLFILIIIWLYWLGYGQMYKLRKGCKKIGSQEELENLLNYYKSLISPQEEILIRAEFLTSKSNKKRFKKAKLYGGAFSDKIGENRYLIVLTNGRYGNEAFLVHELLHIKLGHFEKSKKDIFIRLIQNIFIFDPEINRNHLAKYLKK